MRKPQFDDPEFTEALREATSEENSHQWQARRKARQYCRQVQRALNLALSETNEVYVDEVSPSPDCGRLLVSVTVPPEVSVEEALCSLREMAPSLRASVASATSRKRAPELFFAPVCLERGEHE